MMKMSSRFSADVFSPEMHSPDLGTDGVHQPTPLRDAGATRGFEALLSSFLR